VERARGIMAFQLVNKDKFGSGKTEKPASLSTHFINCRNSILCANWRLNFRSFFIEEV
jgi:hypothetical protein